MLPAIFGENLFDEMFDDMMHPMHSMEKALYGKHARTIMKTDVRETDNSYEVDIDLPGFKKDEVNVQLEDGYLTIKAERKSDGEETDQKGRVIRSERFMGTCQRTFYVGDHVKKEDVAAAYEDGVLKLNVPKKVEQPKVEESHYIDIQ